MIEKKAIYKCEVCGNIVESLWNGKLDLICCGRSMLKLAPNTVDAAKEKHVPVIERNGNVVKVKVGSVAHPMTKEHYILFVELLAGNDVYRHDFKEGDTVAEASFMVDASIPVTAREFCNLHGLWATI
jgi:superoxide reductase